MASPDYKAQRTAAQKAFVDKVAKSNVKNFVPSAIIAGQEAGKSRSRSLKKLIESQKVIPALRNAAGVVTRGLPGETHYNVVEREAKRRGLDVNNFETVEKLIDEYYKPKKGGAPGEYDSASGFTDTRSGKYLTREEAAAKTGTKVGESMQIHKAQSKKSLAVRLAETRRGEDPAESAHLLAKRKQTGRLLHKLNEGISGASNNPSALGKLLNRRGLVRSIARKSKYLGITLAAGDAVKNYMSNTEE